MAQYTCIRYIWHEEDQNDCTEPLTCNTTETCSNICVTLYQRKKGTLTWQVSGCRVKYECPKDDVDECILRHSTKEVYGCCCSGPLCNGNIVINETHMAPKTTISTTTNTTEKTSPPAFASHLPPYILPPVFGFIILTFALFVICKKMRKKPRRDFLLPASPRSSPHMSTRALLKQEIVSRGQFGCVWKADYEGSIVAVKVIQAQEKSSWETEKRIYTSYGLKHENILNFINAEMCCENNMFEYLIITEFHEHGSLSDYLHENIIDFPSLMRLTLSMVTGLAYLHLNDFELNSKKPIISHRDFKSRNVLVKGNLTCCISDFGSACVFSPGDENEEARAQVGTKRYMAPEILQGSIAFKPEAFIATDVYALGLVMWELISRCNETSVLVEDYRAPYEEEVGIHPTIEDMRLCVLNNKTRPKLKDEWREHEKLSEFCETIEECWDDDNEARVTAHCVHERLLKLSENRHEFHVKPVSRMNNSYFSNGKVVVELSDTKPEFSFSSTASSRRTQDTTC